MDSSDLLTVREAAAILKVHQETVRIWLRDGKLQGVRLGGRSVGWRVLASSIERLAKIA